VYLSVIIAQKIVKAVKKNDELPAHSFSVEETVLVMTLGAPLMVTSASPSEREINDEMGL